ncbi:hypothetical protein M0R45_005638 [Rubus argutus]|uniref:Uncharacterized protein n=1 Tax=Rubus argutus TaxID=59490 RepID=A0AAW1YN79_RUBAR
MDNLEVPNLNLLKLQQLDEDEVISFTRRLPRAKGIDSALSNAMPMLRSCLDSFGMSCEFNRRKRFLRFSTTSEFVLDDPHDVITKARELLQLLALNIPPSLAIHVMYGRRCDIMEIGPQKNGLCTTFNINADQFHQRWKLLTAPALEELQTLTSCEILVGEAIVVSFGDSVQALNTIRKVVEECIVYNQPLKSRITSIKATMNIKNLEALRL